MSGSRTLAASKARERLARLNRAAGETPWRLVAGSIRKRFVFADFVEAFVFMSEVALVAEATDHHPNWSNAYKTVNVRLSTHSAGGLTALDFDLATRMDEIAKSMTGPAALRQDGQGSKTA